MKKKRALYNLIVGFGSKIILMVISFLIPKLYIENYGSDVNGLLTSIAQIFAYLSLFEAGVGLATTQVLYKHVANDDWNQINAIINAADRFFKRTGFMYLGGVIITAVAYPLLVDNPLQYYEVFLVIVFSGLTNVLNFFFQSKYVALLNTEGKTYVHVSIATVVQLVTQILKVIMVSRTSNIALVYFVFFVVGTLQVIAINVYIRKNYKDKLNKSIKPNVDALSQHNSVLVHQISSLIFSNTDVLILTAFTSLNTVSIYTVYNLVTTSISNLVTAALDSFTSALGLIYNEDRKRFDRYYDIFELGSWIIYFVLMTVTLLMYTPFVKLYTANADIEYADKLLPYMFVINQLLSFIRIPGLQIMNIEGCFKDTRSRTIIEMIINIGTSIIAVQFIGIYGVLLGTFAALSYRTVDIIIYSNKRIFHRKYSPIIRRLAVNVLLMVPMVLVFKPLVGKVDNVLDFLIYGVIVTTSAVVLYLAVNFLCEIKNENIKFFADGIKRKILKR